MKERNGELAIRVRAALAGERDVVERRMFGGTAFMVRGKMCVSAGRSRIMCRVDPKMAQAALIRKGCRPVVMRGREIAGYIHVDATVLGKGRELQYWIDTALAYNAALLVGAD